MKLTIKIIGLIIVCLAISSIFVSPALGYVEQYGYEYTSASSMVSKVKIQAHAVYNDNDQGGVTAFGVWVNGDYDTSWCTKMTVKIYTAAYYHREEINWRTGVYTESYWWSYTPYNFMSWNLEYDYCASVPTVWRWTAGATAYGMSMSASWQNNPVASAGTGSGTSDIWRYLGWFNSQYNALGGHEFSALLKIHLINDEARNWADGIWEENWPIERITYIEKIRVKIVFEFYYYLLTWWNAATRTYILGDGSPSTDLNYIPLIEGSIN